MQEQREPCAVQSEFRGQLPHGVRKQRGTDRFHLRQRDELHDRWPDRWWLRDRCHESTWLEWMHRRVLGQRSVCEHDSHDRLPPGNVTAERPTPMAGASWLVFLLPYVEHDALWREAERAHKAAPIYTTHNRFTVPPHTAFAQPVAQFVCPADGRTGGPVYSPYAKTEVAFTWYLGVSGNDTLCELDGIPIPGQASKCGVFGTGSKFRFADVRDGLSNTLFIGERPPPAENVYGFWYGGFPWGSYAGALNTAMGITELDGDQYNRDTHCIWPYEPDCSFTSYYQPGSLRNPESRFHYWSFHPGGANFAFVDGSVRFLTYSARPIMPALASRAGGEVVVIDE